MLVLGERLEPEVIQDEQRGGYDGPQAAIAAPVGTARGDPSHERARAAEEHVMAAPDRLMADGLSKMTLAHAGWPDQKDVFIGLHEGAQGDFPYRRFMDAGIEGEVEGLEGLVGRQTRLHEPAGKLFSVAALDLVLEKPV